MAEAGYDCRMKSNDLFEPRYAVSVVTIQRNLTRAEVEDLAKKYRERLGWIVDADELIEQGKSMSITGARTLSVIRCHLEKNSNL